MCDVFIDRGDQLWYAENTPRRSRSVVMSRKKRSTMFSHEAEVGVKCIVKRGCLSSHCWTLGFCGVVVDDQVQRLVLGGFAVDFQNFNHSVWRGAADIRR